MWIVQELLLAREPKLLCGEDVFTWDEMLLTLTYHEISHCSCQRKKDRFHDKLSKTPGAVIVSAKKRYLIYKSKQNIELEPHQLQLVQMITTWAGQHCSDLRDKVYALVGLLQVEAPTRIFLDVDYEMPLEYLFSQVLSEAASACKLASDELRAFIITLQSSLEVCPSDSTVRSAIKEALSAFGEGGSLHIEDFPRKHIMMCNECDKRMQITQHRASSFDMLSSDDEVYSEDEV
jgi:hypothetical protein